MKNLLINFRLLPKKLQKKMVLASMVILTTISTAPILMVAQDETMLRTVLLIAILGSITSFLNVCEMIYQIKMHSRNAG